ncbi:MAG: hypothetical protein WD894_16010 [Pirellulales bacterium]
MVASFLFGRKHDLTLPESDIAGPGMAVHYKEDDSGRSHWHVIEDGSDPDPARNEFGPEHGLSRTLTGKRAGEPFFVRQDSVHQRTATILEVWSKYKLRFNLCMEEWENRFPEHYFLWKFSIKKDAQHEADFAEILKTVDQRIEETHKREEFYRTNPLSVTNFGVMLGVTVLDAVEHIGNQTDLPIRCCPGTDDDFQSAESALEAEAPLLLDGSALASLFMTGTYIHLGDLGLQLAVSEGTLHEYRRRYLEKLNSPREGGFLTKHGNRYVLLEETPEQVERRLGKFQAFLDIIVSVANVEEGMPLADLQRDTRQTLIGVMGRPSAETVAIAASEGFAVWTDDMCVAAFTAENTHAKRVWTDVVFRWARNRGRVSSVAYQDLVADLVRLGYFYTRVEAEILIRKAQQAEWSLADPKFASLLDWLGNPYTKREGIIAIAGKVLPEVVRNANSFRANTVVTHLLTRISTRRDGNLIIRTLYEEVDPICGIDVNTARTLKQLFQLWKNV